MRRAAVLMWTVEFPGPIVEVFGALRDGTIFGAEDQVWSVMHRPGGVDSVDAGLAIMERLEARGGVLVVQPTEVDVQPSIVGDIREDRNWAVNAIPLLIAYDMTLRRNGFTGGLRGGGQRRQEPLDEAGGRDVF